MKEENKALTGEELMVAYRKLFVPSVESTDSESLQQPDPNKFVYSISTDSALAIE